MTYPAKYIAVDGDLIDEIYVFPNHVTHNNFAFVMGFHNRDILGAGFVSPELKCYGESISLKVKSRAEDTALLEKMINPQTD